MSADARLLPSQSEEPSEPGHAGALNARRVDAVEVSSQDALRASQQQYEALVWTSAQIVWETNVHGETETDSPSWRDFTGQTFDEWIGLGWLDALHPDYRAGI